MSIDKELSEMIKKNLPEATAGALRERLEDLEETEKLYKKAVKIIGKAEIKEKELLSELCTLKERVLSENELKELRQKLESQECSLRDQETVLYYKEQMLALKEEHANTRVNDHKEMFSTVFRNTTLRNTLMTDKIIGGGDTPIQTGYNGEHIPLKNPDTTIPITELEIKTEE
jgi:hypothetical protein